MFGSRMEEHHCATGSSSDSTNFDSRWCIDVDDQLEPKNRKAAHSKSDTVNHDHAAIAQGKVPATSSKSAQSHLTLTNTSPHTHTHKQICQTHSTSRRSRRPKRSCTKGNKRELHVNNCRLTSAAAMFSSQECANDRCQNQRVKRNNWKRTIVRETEEKGKGLYSGTLIKKNEIIVEYRGAIIDEWELKRQQKCQASLYVAWCDGWLVDSRNCTSSPARYINHSCDPNCELQQFGLDGKTAKYLYIVAKRNIQKDKELTYDYQWNGTAGRHPTKCKCASVKCRGTIEVFI